MLDLQMQKVCEGIELAEGETDLTQIETEAYDISDPFD